MKIFGERLRELRKEKGLTAMQLGKELGFSDATIIRWENGTITPSIDRIPALVKFFKTTAGYLIGTED